MVKNGVSRYPFLIFNSDSTIYYRTYYKQSSCGATHPSYGSNQFFVNAFKIGPCPGSQAPAVAGPAVISVPPDAIIEAPLTVCINETVLIEDVSISGQLVKASGQNYNCDTTIDGYWEIFNATWNSINPPGSGIQSLTGTLGSSNGVPSIPAFWTVGSKNISLSFNATGTYHIVKHIGTSSSSGPQCAMDSDTLTICVDSIPLVQPALTVIDTICLGDDIDFTFIPDSVNCDSLNTYAFYVIDLDSSNIVYQDSSETNLSHSYTPTSTGPYQTIARVSNHCGSSTLIDTIYVFDSPDVTLDSIAVCGDSVVISFGVPPYAVTWTDSFAAPDSVYYWITPASPNSWSLLGTNQYGQDSIVVWDAKNYTIHATAYNICGQVNLNTNFRLDSIPNPNFVLQDTSGCDSLQPGVSNVYTAPGYTHIWNVFSDTLIDTYNSATPTFTTYYSSSGTIFTIQHIVISDQGCSDTAETNFFINPTPLAAFNIDSAACAPWNPTITDSSQGNIVDYNWYIDPNGTFTSLATLTGNNSSSPTLGFSDLQWPNNNQQYQLSLTVTSDSGCTHADTVDLTLYARPKAGFILPNDSCGPFTLTPNDTSKTNNNINNWLWTLTGPNGTTTSTLSNPTFNLPKSFNGTQNYTLSLQVTDANGCQDSITNNFQVFPTPTADFTLLQDTVCTGTNINTILSNNSTDTTNNLTYNWNIDTTGTNLYNTSDTIPSYTLLNNGNGINAYTITLTVTNNYGCDSTLYDTLYIAPNAIAQLDLPPSLDTCAPFTIDTSIITANHFPGNDSYTWFVIDSSATPIVTSFNGINSLNYTITDDSTTVTIKLLVSSKYDCLSDSITVDFTTRGNPNPQWSLVDYAGCAPFTPQINSIADSSFTHTWIIYNSAGTALNTLNGINPTWPALTNNSYTLDELYSIKHIIEDDNGCINSDSIDITVWPTPLAAFNIDSAACAPWNPTITDSSQGNIVDYNWFIDPNGTFTSLATLTGNNSSSPTLGFSDLQWPNNNQQYQLSLTVTSDSGCTHADTVDLTLYARPKAGFILPNDSCGPFTLTPNDTSKTNNNINNWLWTLTGPNGTTTSTLSNPTFNLPKSFNGTQNYTLSLQVTDANGCQDSITNNFQVFPTPTADFTLLQDTVCTGTNINTILSNNSTDTTNNLTYNWNIDTTGTNLYNTSDTIPSYTLLNNGNGINAYTITLTVTNNYGCDSILYDTIYIAPNAIAQINLPPSLDTCAPFTIDTSIITANHFPGNDSYTWYVIDSSATPIVTSFNGINSLNYTITDDSTTVTIKLLVSSKYDCLSDSITVDFTTRGNPNPQWSLVDYAGCAPFTPQINSIADSSFTHTWIIYNSAGTALNTLNGINPTWPALTNNSYTLDELYSIKHIIEDDNGCINSDSIDITVWPTPLAAFNIDSAACAPWNPTITDSSQGNIVDYNWFIDPNGTFTSLATLTGNNSSSPTLGFSDLQWPNNNQQYQLSLTVTSDSGCTHADTVDLTLYARPKAGFILPNDSCGPFTLTPNDTSKTNNNINNWLWTLTGPNGTTTSTLSNPTFNLPKSFNGTQNYTLSLQVTDANGCQDSITNNFQVFPTPTADFTLLQDTVCTGTNINTILSNNSTDTTNNLTYNWNIDTTGTNLYNTSDTIPSYTLLNNGNGINAYTITLTVTNNYGCDSTLYDTLYIAPNAIAQLNLPPSLDTCAPFTIDTSIITANHFPGNDSYTWYVIDSSATPIVTSFNGINSLNYTITDDSTTVTIKLLVSSKYDCLSDSITVDFTTRGNPNPQWSLVDYAGCAPFTPQINSIADSSFTHTWIIYNSAGTALNTLNGINPTWPALTNNSYTLDELYSIKHIIEDDNGCINSDSIDITVWPTPLAAFNIDSAACAPWNPTITDSSQGNIVDYNWFIDPNGTFTSLATLTGNNSSSPTLGFSDLQWPNNNQQYQLSLTVTSDSGCTHADTVDLTLYARPKAGFILPNDSCGPFTLTPNDTSKTNNNINNWLWTLTGPNGTTTSTLSNPTFNLPKSFNGTQNYTLSLQVTDANGCQDSITNNFQVFPTPTADFTLLQDTVCTGTNINTILSNNSTDTTNNLTYNWNIDTTGTNLYNTSDTIPSYTLLNNGNGINAYTITLTVTNNYGCDSTLYDTLYIAPNAIAQLNLPPSLDTCAPFTIDTSIITANHFPGNDSYTWYVIDSSATPIVTSFNGINSLNYTITNSNTSVLLVLEVTSSHGCLNDSDSLVLSTHPNPDPYFTLESDTGCTAFIPDIISVTDTGTNVTHNWTIIDANGDTVATLQGINPTLPALTNLDSSGLESYTVVHIVSNNSTSCDSSYTQNVYVLPLAIPEINNIGPICALDTIPLSGTSSNDSLVEQWMWVIGTDTLYGQNTSYFNSTPGIYNISLTTTSLDSCIAITDDTVTVHSYPVAGISITDCGVDTVCINQPFNFFDNSSTSSYGGMINDYEWDFDNDGSIDYTTQNGSHTYTSTGLKVVKLKVATQYYCEDDTLISIYVNAPPLNNFDITDSALCGPTTFNISESDTGIVDSSYYELFTYSTGTKTVLQSWNSLPNPLPTLQPNFLGNMVYYVSREIFNCCGSDYVEDSIIIQTPPVADFAIMKTGTDCSPMPIELIIDTLLVAADSVYIDFGDGSDTSVVKTLQPQPTGPSLLKFGNIPHTFINNTSTTATFNITLEAWNDCGDSSITKSIIVYPNTIDASFTWENPDSNDCAPMVVNFSNLTMGATTIEWCFDWDLTIDSCASGSTSFQSNPSYTFTQSGAYTVALFVDNGCSFDTAYQTIVVDPAPTAIIDPLPSLPVCRNSSITFTHSSIAPNQGTLTTVWDFGDGTTSSLSTPTHQYAAAGTYVVSLTVQNSALCDDIAYDTIIIHPTPLVSFSHLNSTVCVNDTVYFIDSSSIPPPDSIVGIAWDFGDGNTSNQRSPKHVYLTAGTYIVRLVLESNLGCIDSSELIVFVRDIPQVAFSPVMIAGDSCSVPQSYVFNNSTTNAIQYNWDFDYANNPGVNTSTLNSPTFTFTSPGLYTVALFAENAFGCEDSLFKTILVRDGVSAQSVINPLDGCEPLAVNFVDTSIYTPQLDTIASVQWFFGDGTSLTQTTPPFNTIHTYQNYGTYPVYSIVTMTSGCSDTSNTTNINVFPTPLADFSINKININTRLFQNNTQSVDPSITYSWTFSDGQSSAAENPTMTFEPSTTGLDSIRACLTVINSYGCSDSICKDFWIWPTNLIVPNSFAPGLDYVGEDALFLPKGHSLEKYEIWIYDKWGALVWHSTKIDPQYKSPGEGWNGKYMGDGEDLPMGVYSWKIEAVFDDGTRWTGQENVHGFQKDYGTLTLIR